MKKFYAGFLFIALLPMALIVGCNSASVPSGAGGPSGPTATPHNTSTPAAFTTPQTTTMAMVNLGSAANFGALSYAGITNSGFTRVCGSIGTFPSASVDGGITVQCGGSRQIATGAANTALIDLGTAYTDAMGRSGGVILPPGADIGGQTFYPGLYSEVGNLNVSSQDIYLDAQGNANAVFIFQVQGNLIVGSGRKVILSNSANAAHIFWAVAGYAALNTTVSFVGNIMSHTAVTMNTGAKLNGRALASTQNVTFLANTITFP